MNNCYVFPVKFYEMYLRLVSKYLLIDFIDHIHINIFIMKVQFSLSILRI